MARVGRCRAKRKLGAHFRAQIHFQPCVKTDAGHVYRIAQEALPNAARHGGATRVDIFLAATAPALSLRITDNGEGFARAAEPLAGMGLKIMKYRADMIGAKFAIEPNQPHGAVITVAG